MSRIRDRSGEKYGRLTVLCEAPRDQKGRVRWHCQCDCGNETTILVGSVGKTLSCGCLQREKAAAQGSSTFKDRTGERVGRLLIVEAASRNERNRPMWRCKCDCGVEIIASGGDLYGGRTTSCGCLQIERTSAANAERAKHGHARNNGLGGRATTPEYRSWKAMLERCRNKNAPNYHLYGGRGITVCDRWQGVDGFTNFLSDMGNRPDDTTLDRYPDKDGNYEPSNCRWATPAEQSNNRRQTPEGKAAQAKALEKGRRWWPRKAAF